MPTTASSIFCDKEATLPLVTTQFPRMIQFTMQEQMPNFEKQFGDK